MSVPTSGAARAHRVHAPVTAARVAPAVVALLEVVAPLFAVVVLLAEVTQRGPAVGVPLLRRGVVTGSLANIKFWCGSRRMMT